jgi:[glutamine synthetase] adenylyltransferase / [glutamine synthetase]-adenylyl-L-tyrosine phosphorylase
VELDELLRSGPDPTHATAYLSRFVEAGGEVPPDDEGRRLLAAVLSNGGYLADLLLADVTGLSRLAADPYLHRRKPREEMRREIAVASRDVTDLRSLQRALRRYTRREMLRLGAREIGWGTTLDVAWELSGLADGVVDQAVRVAETILQAQFGVPEAGPDADRPPSFVVLGMGKLGGEELNFSSDIDLVYLYASDDGRAGTLTLHEYYARLSQLVTQAIGDTTEDGIVFRVDLRLRPEGRSGAICNSLPAAERYYETFGRTWERQALLRARPIAGNLALGEEFLSIVAPFVFPRTLGPQAIDDVLALRRLFRAKAGSGGFDVKLGLGGIRDVELVAQLLQLLNAGRRRELRERATLRALHKLTLVGLLSDREQRILSEAYRFLRRVEHRLQLEQGGQTHALPADEAGYACISRRLGYAGGSEFTAVLEQHRSAVVAISNTLGEPASAPPVIVLRLLDPASSRADIEADLGAAGFADVKGSADVLELVQSRMPPEWLAEILSSPDPDRALAHFCDLAQHGSLGLFTLLREHPQLLRMLAGLFGTSDRLSNHLITHPALWEPLVSGLGEPRPAPETWQTALPKRLEGLDEEEALREMRRYQAEEVLRIGIHDVVGNLEAQEVSQQLTALGEACLGAAVREVARRLGARYGVPDAGLTVLAYGSFGARETRYGSDLDLVFLFTNPGTTDRGMDHQEWFARLAQRLINALGALMDEGRLYEVDARLRPSGAQGLLVTSYPGFDRYHHEEAAPWERVALLRARPVFTADFGTEARAGAIGRLLEEATYERPVEVEALRRDLLRMRGRIQAERAKIPGGMEGVHLRFSPGGLTDLEFLAAFEQLRRGGQDPRVRTAAPRDALATLAARGELPEGGALVDDHDFLQRAALRVRLLRDEPNDHLAGSDFARLGRALGVSEAEFRAELIARMTRVRRVFAEVVGLPE